MITIIFPLLGLMLIASSLIVFNSKNMSQKEKNFFSIFIILFAVTLLICFTFEVISYHQETKELEILINNQIVLNDKIKLLQEETNYQEAILNDQIRLNQKGLEYIIKMLNEVNLSIKK